MIILLVILIAVSFLIVVLSMDGRADMPAADIKPVEELPLVLADGKPRCARMCRTRSHTRSTLFPRFVI